MTPSIIIQGILGYFGYYKVDTVLPTEAITLAAAIERHARIKGIVEIEIGARTLQELLRSQRRMLLSGRK